MIVVLFFLISSNTSPKPMVIIILFSSIYNICAQYLLFTSDVSGCQKSGSGRVRVLNFFFGFGSGRVLDFFFGFGSGSGYTTRVRVGFRVLFWHIKMPFLG